MKLETGAARFRVFPSHEPNYGIFAVGLIFAACVSFALDALLISALLVAALFAGFFYLVLRRREIVCGTDGFVLGKRFVRWSDVHDIEEQWDRDIKVVLNNGAPALHFSFAFGREPTAAEIEERAGFLAAARAARDALQPNATSDVATRLARSGRPVTEWLASLEGDTAFRVAPLRDEDLWRVVEDPAAPPTARAAGAALLARRAGGSERPRLRVAADACVEPRLRVVLDQAAEGAEEEELARALESVT